MKIYYKKSSININAKELSQIGMFTGLMFRTSKTQNLLFIFNKKRKQYIHSFFVFFPFLAIWLDEKDVVVKTQVVTPFKPVASSGRAAKKLIEVPFNFKNRDILSFFVDKGKDLNIR